MEETSQAKNAKEHSTLILRPTLSILSRDHSWEPGTCTNINPGGIDDVLTNTNLDSRSRSVMHLHVLCSGIPHPSQGAFEMHGPPPTVRAENCT